MNEPTSTDNYVQIGDRVINRTVDASVTTDDVSLNDRVFVFKKNDDGSIKTVVNTTIQYVVDAFGADAVATKNEVVTLKNDVVTLKEQASAYASSASSSASTASTKASEASASASTASTKASEASSSASTASTKASEASASAVSASTKATEASDSATLAKQWAVSASLVNNEDYSSKYYANKASGYSSSASASASTASTKASEASSSASSASTCKSDAESARDKALQYRNEAEQLSQSLCYFRKQTYSISASAGATDITIPSEAQYRNLADILIVHNKGVALAEGTEYTKTSTGITLAAALTSATTIEIDILRAVSTDSQSYDLLKGDKGDKGDDGLYSKSQLLDMIYPVGAIYTSLKNTSPASTLGGTWTAIEGDRVLWSVANGAEYLVDSNGNPLTGGSSSHSHNYGVSAGGYCTQAVWVENDGVGLLTYDTDNNMSVKSFSGNSSILQLNMNTAINASASATNMNVYTKVANTSYTSNIPPYIKVYMWRRTA